MEIFWCEQKEPIFNITLTDLKILADAMCEVDSGTAPFFDRDMRAKVKSGHDAIVRTLGPDVCLVYGFDDGSMPVGVP